MILYQISTKLPAALPIPSSPKTLSGLSASPPCLPGRPRRPCGACPHFLLLPSPAPARLGLIHDRDVFSRFSDEKWAPHAAAPVREKAVGAGGMEVYHPKGVRYVRGKHKVLARSLGLLLYTSTGFFHLDSGFS